MTFSVASVFLIAAVLLAIGGFVLLLVQVVSGRSELFANLWLTLAQEACVVIGVCIVFSTPISMLGFCLAVMAARLGYEVSKVARLNLPQFLLPAVCFALTALALLIGPQLWVGAGLLCLCLIGFWARNFGGSALKDGKLIDVLLYPILPFVLLALVVNHPAGPALLLAGYLLIETFDSYALLFGKVFGKRRVFPVLSPNKTLEGLVGGTLMLLMTAAIASVLFDDLGPFTAILFALLAGCCAVIGDLTASRLKRRAGVKDFPVLAVRFGGALDHFDGWIVFGAGISICLLLGFTF